MDDHFSEISWILKVPESSLKKHFETGSIQKIEEPVTFYRFKHALGHVEKGTVVFITQHGLEFMRGYPKISRLFVIEKGFKSNFESAFVEEKLDGYNVRCAFIGNKFVALTRGGLVCPYTTQRLYELIGGNKFFRNHPELMLCGEVVGLQNPYQEKGYPEAKKFDYFVFDIRDRITGKALTIPEKKAMTKEYGLRSVRDLGLFHDGKKLLKMVRDLGKMRREGVVLKSPGMDKMMKYTANHSTNKDLQYAFKYYSDYGQSFMYQRLVREAFQAYELGLTGKHLEHEAAELGKSILIPMVETIRRIAEGGEVTEDFEIQSEEEGFGEEFADHLRHLGVVAGVKSVKKVGKHFIFTISRHYHSTNDRTNYYLKGGTESD